jgi:hypothetical protein
MNITKKINVTIEYYDKRCGLDCNFLNNNYSDCSLFQNEILLKSGNSHFRCTKCIKEFGEKAI